MKKILAVLMSLVVVLSLVGCGSASAETTSAPMPAPVVTESTPEPEPEATVEEAVEETPVEEVVEEPAAEEVEEVEEEPVEEEPAEPTEEELAEEVLANEEFYEGDVFVPKLYAQSIGYKWYGDYDGEDTDLSITIDGIEYFVYYLVSSDRQSFNVVYTDGSGCYGITIADVNEEDRDEVIKISTGGVAVSDSKSYVESTISVLNRLAAGDVELKKWTFDGLSYGYSQYDCAPGYFDDGYIDSSSLTNKNEEESFTVSIYE